MARKKKKNTKINQKIKYYFDDDPFDVGIERVPSETLSELFATLGIYDVEHNKNLLLKTIRMIWSEADGGYREDILRFFEANGVIYVSDKPKEPSFDRETKIETLLEELDLNDEEAFYSLKHFPMLEVKKSLYKRWNQNSVISALI
jgi:ATP-dependent RNA helicase SUPV3L1/SUV3